MTLSNLEKSNFNHEINSLHFMWNGEFLVFARYESLPALIVCKYYYCYYYSYSVSIRWLSIYFRNSQCVFLVMNSNGSFRLLVKTFLSVCLIVSLKMSKKIFQVFASLPENVMENIFSTTFSYFLIFQTYSLLLFHFCVLVFSVLIH